MKNKYLFIPADLRLPCSFVEIDYPEPRTDNGSNKFNDAVNKLIGCEIYESVWIYSDLVMLVDDVGKMVDKPINLRASRFYSGTAYGDPIVGDVLICGVHEVESVYDGELISEKDFGPLSFIHSMILAEMLDIPLNEPA